MNIDIESYKKGVLDGIICYDEKFGSYLANHGFTFTGLEAKEWTDELVDKKLKEIECLSPKNP